MPPWTWRQQARLQEDLPRGAGPSGTGARVSSEGPSVPWGPSPASPVEKTLLDTVTLSSGTLAQSPVARQPFMGKLMSVAPLAGSLWMLRTVVGTDDKRKQAGRQTESSYVTRNRGPEELGSGPGGSGGHGVRGAAQPGSCLALSPCEAQGLGTFLASHRSPWCKLQTDSLPTCTVPAQAPWGSLWDPPPCWSPAAPPLWL